MYTLGTETFYFLMLSTPTVFQRHGQKTHVCNCYTNRNMAGVRAIELEKSVLLCV